ncbi:MAG TPA: phospholipase, partial [Erysipelothrix sp.]|nr:phospholipase [Erysipelothrix sp.]
MFERVPNILEIVKQKAERFGLEEMWVLGFSNGANTISAMLLNRETPFKKAILLRPMDITLDAPINDLKNIDILIHSGRFDDIIPMESSIALEHRLRSKNAIVENIIYDLDHRMRQYEIDELKNWFERKKND